MSELSGRLRLVMPWVIVGVTIVLMWLTAFLMRQDHLSEDIATLKASANSELSLLASIADKNLRQGNYQDIDTIMLDWGQSNSDVSRLSLTSGNGFLISEYLRNYPLQHPLTVEVSFNYGYEGQATITLVKDLGAVIEHNDAAFRELSFALLLLSILLVVLATLLHAYRGNITILRQKSKQLRHEQEAARLSEQRFRALVESSSLPMLVVDDGQDNNIMLMNHRFTELFGYTKEDVWDVNSWWLRAYPDKAYRNKVQQEWQDGIDAMLANGESTTHAMLAEAACADGSKRCVEVSMTLQEGYGLVVFNDLTERMKTEKIMVQTEKMMSVGGLAAGMAHELNNPLAGILQGMQNITRRLSPQGKKNIEVADELNVDLVGMWKYFEKRDIAAFFLGMQNAAERAALIVHNMLKFSRKTDVEFGKVEVVAMVDEALELAAVDYDVQREYDFRHIEIVKEYDPTLKPVSCIEAEIQQVLLNLFANAARALHSENSLVESPRIIIRAYEDQGNTCIDIEDNGNGMDEKTQKHAFDPFFTTRPPGEGTGLGLSVSYFIVTQEHNGQMSVESQPGRGARFTLCLPREG